MKVIQLGFIALMVGFGFILTPIALNAAEQSAFVSQQGELVVYRKDKNNRRKGVYFNLYVNNKKVGKMKHNRAFHLSLKPGKYRLSSNDKTDRHFQVEVLAGHETRVKTGIVKNRHYAMSYQCDDANEYANHQNLKHQKLTLK